MTDNIDVNRLILEKELQRTNSLKDLMLVQDEKEFIEAKIRMDIFNAVNDNGKPSFSNESARDSESIIRMRLSPEWADLRKKEIQIIINRMILENEIDYNKRKFEVIQDESIAGMYKKDSVS